MSTYHYVGCKTCKKKLDLAGHSTEGVITSVGEFMMYDHTFHDVVLVHDLAEGWADDLYHEVLGYETVEER